MAVTCKTEAGVCFPASDYAYVPDAASPSTWKLRLTKSPGGDPDPGIVGAAIAALGPGGFRGNKVQIPDADLPKVKAKVRTAWKKANPDKTADEMPSTIKLSVVDAKALAFGSLPPALEANLVKKLKADLAKEKDPAKKAKLEAEIKKHGGTLSGDTEDLGAEVETFDLKKLNSALDNINSVIDALQSDPPKVASALSNAKDAADQIKAAIKVYSGDNNNYPRRVVVVRPPMTPPPPPPPPPAP